MSDEQVMTNARIVTRHAVVEGSVRIGCGTITAIDEGDMHACGAVDWEGDYLLPGLIELHTDNLEKHLMPRPKVRWPEFPALIAHDAEVAAAGITTVFDALGVGDVDESGLRGQDLAGVLAVIDRAIRAELLRADHRVHVRCELAAPNTVTLFQPFADHPLVGLISLMDHTPGQRQWTNLEQARIYYTGKKGWSDDKFHRVVGASRALQEKYALPHRRHFLGYAQDRAIPLASHDDTTVSHVEQALDEGITISEFPTTEEAAHAARSRSIGIVMGAPNVVRGGSHSGNVGAVELACKGLLDVLSSDYVPSSLLHAAFMLTGQAGFSVPDAIATVRSNPARLAHLIDRGEIACGKRADLCRVRLTSDGPTVLAVWREGRRVV
ncbi:MAG TPA: alpha-D-ribose 1-methylphosphonate 5-triphosphate diphosphatase [Burkholderiales bacterium]|nr:alpha-D-ribose 1-methylphosphonate 5-triphosphate diphosphatase [Burkholderiales bacterium]